MQHLVGQWRRSAAGEDGVRHLILPKDDHETAHGHIMTHLGPKTAATFDNPEPATDWGKKVMHEVTKNKGFSFHDHIGDGPSSGYMVSTLKGAEQTIPLRDITSDHVADFRDVHQQELKNPNNYLGAWVHKGKVYLDVSTHVQSREQAHHLARQHKQIGVFSLANFETEMTEPHPSQQRAASITDRRPGYVRGGGSDEDFVASLKALGGY